MPEPHREVAADPLQVGRRRGVFGVCRGQIGGEAKRQEAESRDGAIAAGQLAEDGFAQGAGVGKAVVEGAAEVAQMGVDGGAIGIVLGNDKAKMHPDGAIVPLLRREGEQFAPRGRVADFGIGQPLRSPEGIEVEFPRPEGNVLGKRNLFASLQQVGGGIAKGAKLGKIVKKRCIRPGGPGGREEIQLIGLGAFDGIARRGLADPFRIVVTPDQRQFRELVGMDVIERFPAVSFGIGEIGGGEERTAGPRRRRRKPARRNRQQVQKN